jgi:FkbM family methyltransferase
MKKNIRRVLNKLGLEVSLVKSSPKYNYIEKNTIVSNKVGDYTLLMNHAHIHNADVLSEQYSKNLPLIVKEVFDKYPETKVVDIGANIGDSVALVKSLVEVPMLCIEGDDFYFNLLKENTAQFENTKIFQRYLGEVNMDINARPIQDNGSLKIDTSDNSSSITIQKFDTLSEQFPLDFKNVKVFKIDTDGFDLKILRGAKEALEKDKPVVFFEYSEKHLKDAGDDGLSIFPFLGSMGYKFLMFYDCNGRFIFSTEFENQLQIEQIHLYISNYSAPLFFLDIAAFHFNDKDIYERVMHKEMEINKRSANRIIANK